MLMLLCATTSASICSYQQTVCECAPDESECYFSLTVEDLIILSSYKLDRSDSGELIGRRENAKSSSYIFNNTGQLVPAGIGAAMNVETCLVYDERFHENDCSIPMIVDSIGNGAFIGVNGLLPGPTLVVNEGQTVVIDVTNTLINKEISIHWHGQFQYSTPWMDGVDHITQCPIPTYAQFRYIFKAQPSGTMWYHSHVGTQRTEGLFGALIVREQQDTFNEAQRRLENLIDDTFMIVDIASHTLTFLDWQDADAVEITIRTISRNLPLLSINENSSAPNIEPPVARLGPDGTIIRRVSFHAGLINGLGKPDNISYSRSRLSIFDVQPYNSENPVYYRFRLVGSQRRNLFRFSISEHRLIVIAADGFLTKPKEVDYMFVHAGERYDFLLKPKTEAEANQQANYLMIAETLDSNCTVANNPKCRRAVAILHYGDEASNPTSTQYQSIIMESDNNPRPCNSTSRCNALNCPFKFYAPSFYINCVPVTELQLLFPTPMDNLPSNTIDRMENEHFFDFAFQGESGSAAISGRNFEFPAGSLQTDVDSTFDLDCKSGYLDCKSDSSFCVCQHIVNITDKATIQFVLSNLADPVNGKAAHPIHLHGHTFQVAGIYYGNYFENGTLKSNNDNITCSNNQGGNDPLCTNPTWTNPSNPVDGTVNATTVRKDTIIVPPGGYVVLRFISDNWGFWYMHCHIEPHFLEGMALVVNEGYELQNTAPEQLGFLQCGDFNWTVEEFNMKLNNPTERRSAGVIDFCRT